MDKQWGGGWWKINEKELGMVLKSGSNFSE
jgi:hypothetical protein